MFCNNCEIEKVRVNGNCTARMASDSFIARCGQPWAAKKAKILELYNHLFTEGMKNKYKNLCYIDIFSGPGIYFNNSDGSEKDGSPLIALKRNYSRYFLNDINAQNIDALKQRMKGKINKIKFYVDDANNIAKSINSELPNYSLSFCFMDPHNMSELKFETLADISRNKRVDLLINFPYGSDYRRSVKYLMLDESDNKKFDDFFGTNKWKDIEIEYKEKDILFRADALLNLYMNQLEKLGYIKIEQDKRHSYIFPIFNSRNGLLYYLIFVSKDGKGYDFCKKIRKYAIAQQELL